MWQGIEYGMVVYRKIRQSSEYVWIWLNMPEYALMSLNMPEHGWILLSDLEYP